MDSKRVVENIRKEFKEYMVKHNLKSAVLGISGGIDSCVIAALVKPVCDEIGIKLIGRSLPIFTNKEDEISRANIVGKAFCHDFLEDYSLEDVYENMDDALPDVVEMDSLREKIRRGNIKARIRMIYLYNLAYVNKGLVLSTDNLTELNLGYSTIMGDWGDLALIQYLWKTEVYAVATYLKNEYTKDIEKESISRCINCMATNGLGITDGGDLEEIKAASYEEVDIILKAYLFDKDLSYVNHPVVQRYEASHFKRNWPVIVPRENLFK